MPLNPDEGALIRFEESGTSSKVVSGIALNRDECLIKAEGMPTGTQYLSKILKLFADNGIKIDIINVTIHHGKLFSKDLF